MPSTRGNLAQTPINSDTFNLTADLATMADSMEVLVPVANQAAGDTVATSRATAGFAVSDARPLFIYNQGTKTIQLKDTSGWRDLNSPLGLIYQNSVGSASGAMSALTVVFNIATFTFQANRNYRIVWDYSIQGNDLSSLAYFSINTCSTSDAAAVTTGLTTLDGRTKGAYGSVNATEGTGPVTAYYKPGATVTQQIKFCCQRVTGTGSFVVLGNVNETVKYMIYDDGLAV